jgi:hypothetical protein
MRKQKRTGTDLEYLIDKLTSKDGATRQEARGSLVALGKPAVSSLTRTLQISSFAHVRWEAVKKLGAIGDSSAIPSFVKTLEDSDPDVAWMAAEELRKFKKAEWQRLLRLLIKRGAGSALLPQGAHHALRNQREVGFNDVLAVLRKALEFRSVPGSTTVAAYEVLERLKAKP